MKRSKIGLLVLPVIALLGACDDATGPAGDGLSQAEAEALASVLLSQTIEAGEQSDAGGVTATAPVARQVTEFSDELSVTVGCPLGGSVAVDVSLSGSVDSETQNASLSYSVVQAHDACEVQPEETESTLVITGAPNVSSSYSLEITEGSAFDLDGAITGTVEWSTGDRAGTCVISLEFSGSGSEANGFAMSVVGSICSAQVSRQLSVS